MSGAALYCPFHDHTQRGNTSDFSPCWPCVVSQDSQDFTRQQFSQSVVINNASSECFDPFRKKLSISLCTILLSKLHLHDLNEAITEENSNLVINSTTEKLGRDAIYDVVVIDIYMTVNMLSKLIL